MKQFETVWHQGQYSRQAHRDLPDGTFEREMGHDGFNGPATHFYHKQPPTNWESISGPLRPRAFDLNQTGVINSPYDKPMLLSGDSICIGFWKLNSSMQQLVRNAEGDELLFIHKGSGGFFCDFGHLEIVKGDYLVIPKGTMWRIETEEEFTALYVSTVNQHFQVPERGLLGQHALWDAAQLDVPQINGTFKSQEDRPTDAQVKFRGVVSTIHYGYNPLDAVGWKGNLSVVRINVQDLLPVSSHRVHLPPSVHATFECESALISTFLPRPFETDSTALKVPFFHSNEDVDEVLFYHSGDFFSRDNISAGFLTLHPCGLPHGPHPQALNRMFEQSATHTNETAVMIDSKEHLAVMSECKEDPRLHDLEVEGYKNSWRMS